jgi:hypothetical protein
MPQDPGLRGHQQPPLPLVQVREQHGKLDGELNTSLVRDTHTTTTITGTRSNTLIPCKPLGCGIPLRISLTFLSDHRDRAAFVVGEQGLCGLTQNEYRASVSGRTLGLLLLKTSVVTCHPVEYVQ